MKVEVIINDRIVLKEEVDGMTAYSVADWYANSYHISELKACRVSAHVAITGVQSRMNDPNFIVRSEVYDELFFKETVI